MKIAEIEKKLKKMLTEKRLKHSYGVADTAREMAKRFGCDEEKAYLAGLIHDCAKNLKDDETVKLLRKNGYSEEEIDTLVPPVRHADAGVFVAVREFGIDDTEILSAVKLHTTGGPGMTKLDKIIYVADFIEPNRTEIPPLSRAREAAGTDLDEAVRVCAMSTLEHVSTTGQKLNPRTEKMLLELNGGENHDAE